MGKLAKQMIIASTLAGMVVVGGCAKNEESLIVIGVPAWEEDGCSADAGTMEFQLGGVLDVLYGTPYQLPLVLENRLAPQEAETQNSGTDNSELQLTEVDIDLLSAQAPEVIDALRDVNPSFVSFTQPISTNSLSGGDRVVAVVEPISQPASQQLQIEASDRFEPGTVFDIEARVVVKARRSGNRVGKLGEIEAREFLYPIRICVDCLLSCQYCVDQDGETAGCPPAFSNVTGGVCGNAQDLAIYPAVDSCQPT